MLIYHGKNLSMDFVTGFSLSIEWKRDNYDSILVIINSLTKIVYYKPVKTTINVVRLAKVIIDVVIRHHSLPKWIVSNRSFFSNSKSCSANGLAKKLRNLMSITYKIYYILKNSKNASMIKVWSRAATHWVKKFVSIVNTSGPSKIGSLKSSFLASLKFFIRWANRPISLNYQPNGKFIIFSIYYR